MRITNSGYDFLNAIESDKTLNDKFMDYFNRGMSLVEAAMKAIALTKAIS